MVDTENVPVKNTPSSAEEADEIVNGSLAYLHVQAALEKNEEAVKLADDKVVAAAAAAAVGSDTDKRSKDDRIRQALAQHDASDNEDFFHETVLSTPGANNELDQGHDTTPEKKSMKTSGSSGSSCDSSSSSEVMVYILSHRYFNGFSI